MADALIEPLKRVRFADPQEAEGAKLEVADEEKEESEDEESYAWPLEPFRFFDLPAEIRLHIYHYALFTPRRNRPLKGNGSVGASAKNPARSPLAYRLALFLVSKQMHNEAADYFYSTQAFRVFYIQDYSRMPTIIGIPSRYRRHIGTIELILGSSWTNPPKHWKVTKQLGLEEMTRLQLLKIFIEMDPSHPSIEGFRISNNFYQDFAGDLLKQVLERLPNLVYVEFDGNPSVTKNGSLMRRLLHETRTAGKKVVWGPQRKWTDYDKEDMIADKAVYGLGLRKPVTTMSSALLEEVR
ncbi:hypothetical protein BJY04DRAFT_200884 [Aspergillus karnatakaensis]|uniref:uncharacterized protein n=1 Tax=Aspergillus karnatakaensis TaxID=1810916 RepID=UPI003CCCBC10